MITLLFKLVMILPSGDAYVIDHHMSGLDCVQAIEAMHRSGLDIKPYRCEVDNAR